MRTRLRGLGVGVLAALIASAGAAVPAYAATVPSTFPADSNGPVYLVDALDNNQYAANSQLDWDTPAGVNLSSTSGTVTRLPYVTDAATSTPFLSAVGAERTPASWKAFGDAVNLNGKGVLLPNVTPSSLLNGSPAGVVSAGGTYSLGVAYLSGPSTVVAAYYTTINVDAGTGTWAFATPAAPVVITDVATTTTLAADKSSVELGGSVTLTATVAASGKTPAGNVEFYKGTSKLATRALSSGTVSYAVTPGTTGTQTYSAKFVENTVGTDKFLASTSSDLSVDVTTPPPPVVPNAPSEGALNSDSSNGATATYDATTHKVTLNVDAANNSKSVNVFAYSTPTFLGTQTVADSKVVADVSGLASGSHKVAIVDPATYEVIAWASFDKTDAAISPSISKTINAEAAAVAPSDGEFSLTNLSGNTVSLSNPAIVDGKSVVSGTLGSFKVTDLRQVSKPGWKLQTSVTDFAKGTDTIAASALGIKPKSVGQAGSGATAPTLGDEQISGSASYPWDFATLAAGAYSGASTYDADLTFTAPSGKPAGTYTSTLTLTLISK
ncbi:Ig-like domain-containing protein [Propionicimonas paludicola]|uniref:Ig-like domain-containing protein n=1 Tax=Propionicimonas paludicola TaxID=185243 RepID=A0A2A9CU46_9ACTN|nr:Ig-like domain-containing protein [Propionicimonas paludicola]PFG17651.1 Ig-like domain-containing protein [Propionicimonas paludicola]